MRSQKELNEALQNAQRTSAAIRSLHFSWIELQGNEVEVMLEMTSQYADEVTAYLIELSGGDDAEVDHA